MQTKGKRLEIIQNLIALTISPMIMQASQRKYWKIYPQLCKEIKAIKAYPLTLNSLSRKPKGFDIYKFSIDLFFALVYLAHLYANL